MKILIVSLKFTIGMTGHIRAYRQLAQQSGYDVKLYVDKKYADYLDVEAEDYLSDLDEIMKYKPDVAIIQNISKDLPQFIKWCHTIHCKVIYILHEPYMGLLELMKEGSYFPRQLAASVLNVHICNAADTVFLCSDYAQDNVRKYTRHLMKKAKRFPLIFEDDYDEKSQLKREYFSLVGGCGHAHGGDLFLDFAKYAYLSGKKIKFQIATRGDMLAERLQEDVFQKMINEGRMIVQQGRPLTTQEMSEAYRRSICVWNVYRRSTQSGVLPNAFMHGTPVIATKLGSFEEFVESGVNSMLIPNSENETIYAAYVAIRKDIEMMSSHSRSTFIKKFYYGSQGESFKKLVSCNLGGDNE